MMGVGRLAGTGSSHGISPGTPAKVKCVTIAVAGDEKTIAGEFRGAK